MRRCLKPLFIFSFSFSLMLLSLHTGAQETAEPTKGQNPRGSAQNPQEKPNEKKDESSNPAQAPPEKRTDLTTQAAEATKRMAQQGLVRLRDWESGWLTGVYVEKDQPLVPLTREARQQILPAPNAGNSRVL